MNAGRRLGWTLDDLHARIAACDDVLQRDADSDDELPPLFLQVVDEILSLGKDVRSPTPATTLRKLRKADGSVPIAQVTEAARKLGSWLQRQEGDLTPTENEAPLVEASADNLVNLPRGVRTGDGKERLRGLRAERWVALPARSEVRDKVKSLREALGGLGLVLSAANSEADVPFGTLDRKRLAMVVEATRHTLGGPLVERGLLSSVRENAALMERQGGSPTVRTTAKRARAAVESLLDALG